MTTRLLIGVLRTGDIVDEIDATACNWKQTLNDSGLIQQVTVPGDQVRTKDLRYHTQEARCFLAVEQDDRIREAGPIWGRSWDWKTQVLTLSAAGLWSLFDHRKVLPALQPGQPYSSSLIKDIPNFVVSGTDLGGIARALVAQAMTELGGDLPLVLPTAASGTRTETFEAWKLYWVGQQMKELTQREESAPDIRFRPQRQSADRTRIEWVMEYGSEAAPELSQVGADWVFDATAPKTPVLGVGTDSDGSVMGLRAWVTGNGMEQNQLISRSTDYTMVTAQGYPMLEVQESRPTVEDPSTLASYAFALRLRSARPIEAVKVTVRADAASEVLPGDYCRLATQGDAWLPDGEHRTRIAQISGSLDDSVTLDMYPLQAIS